jgi:uncharacterized membrane protein (UPF0127 family)
MRRLFLTALILLLGTSTRVFPSGDKLPVTTVLIPPNLKIEAELAMDDETRMRGLMFRESMPDNAGMLFIFPYVDRHSFWMKNTLIPLDLIWLNERKEVVYYVTAPPCRKDPCDSYIPMQNAKYVLELNGGFMKKHNIPLGTRMEFSLPPGADE